MTTIEYKKDRVEYKAEANSLTCTGRLEIEVYNDKSLSLQRKGQGEHEIILSDNEVDFLIESFIYMGWVKP